MDKFETTNNLISVSVSSTFGGIDDFQPEPEKKEFERKVKRSSTALTTNNLPWIESLKRVSFKAANSRLFGKLETEILFCLSLDGSMDSDNAFHLISSDFLFENVKLLCVYISNNKLDSKLNYNNRKSTIVDKYSGSIKSLEKRAHFVVEDRAANTHHFLEQTFKYAENYSANFIVVPYNGLKGPRGDNKELAFGLNYMFSYARIPVILIKEKISRAMKEDKAFKFLVVFDNAVPYCTRVFMNFMPFYNCEIDTIDIIEAVPEGNKIERGWKNDHCAIAEKNEIKNFSYDEITYQPKSGFHKQICNIINYGKVVYDFVVFYNVPSKHKSDLENSNALNIASNCQASLCFLNN